ncbi:MULTISPECIES: helix-turn-helix transcriptional regulator [unclassified Streptomyces]|uniref:helix-turn-helix transcriptional regulator n=1 Tax=unclassified Streptomyces TaxID=2593676 RepID=UPI001F5298E3|nr:helix-turn-helix transcriptional regulator [Streptomyces sp. TSRI0107]
MTEELAAYGYQTSPGTLCPTLHRLEADGLLTSKHGVVEGWIPGGCTRDRGREEGSGRGLEGAEGARP